MARSTDDKFLHDWVVRSLIKKYSRLYTEININSGDERNFELNGKYPDAVFMNYGQIMQIVEVETTETISEDRVDYWKCMSELGAQLVVLVPKESQGVMRDICWNSGLSAKVKIGTFDVNIVI